MKFLASILLCTLLLAGCASSGVKVSPEAAAAFKTGEATEADIVAKLGKPTSVIVTNGVRLIQYSGMQYNTHAATFIPVVGLFAGGSDIQMTSVMFQFDASGKLTKTTSTEHNTSTRRGSPAP